MKILTLIKPDDWHLHFRDGDILKETVAATARCFQRAIVMPNLVPPVINADMAVAYQQRINDASPEGSDFVPLMTLYLTNETTVGDIRKAKQAGIVAAKLYPAGATTNSSTGVTHLDDLSPVFKTMEEEGLLLLVHGEVTDHNIDIFDREKTFIDQHMVPLLKDFPELKVVFEHITTAEAAQFVEAGNKNLAATITPQHLMYERNHMLVGGIKPHLYCLPILKRRKHQEELVRVATQENNEKFFLGSDSAPHSTGDKESACGCAGCFSGHATLELYAEVFEQENALDQLEAFASHNGPDFYGLKRNKDKVLLTKKPWNAPNQLDYDGKTITPLRAGEPLQWTVSEISENTTTENA